MLGDLLFQRRLCLARAPATHQRGRQAIFATQYPQRVDRGAVVLVTPCVRWKKEIAAWLETILAQFSIVLKRLAASVEDWVGRQRHGGELIRRDAQALDQGLAGELGDRADMIGALDRVAVQAAAFFQRLLGEELWKVLVLDIW